MHLSLVFQVIGLYSHISSKVATGCTISNESDCIFLILLWGTCLDVYSVQSGFGSQHSATTVLMYITDYIFKAVDEKIWYYKITNSLIGIPYEIIPNKNHYLFDYYKKNLADGFFGNTQITSYLIQRFLQKLYYLNNWNIRSRNTLTHTLLYMVALHYITR